MFRTILIPLDGTPGAEAAIAPAAEIARRFGSEVILLSVTPGYGPVLGATLAEPFGAPGSVAAAGEAEAAAEAAGSAYLDAVRTAQGAGAESWRTLLGEGDSAEAIVEAARANNADLIVLATHARSGLKRLFLGSVSEDVIRHASVPILVVHMDDEGE